MFLAKEKIIYFLKMNISNIKINEHSIQIDFLTLL